MWHPNAGGAIPGVAGKFTISAERGIGLPNVGTLFSASGSVSIMFNVMPGLSCRPSSGKPSFTTPS